MRQLKTHLITMKNVLFGNDFISKFCYIYSVYKNYQILSLHLSNVSYSSPQTPSCNHIWLLQKPMHPYFFCIIPWILQTITTVIANTFTNYFASIAKTTKKAWNIHINIFQIIFQMKVEVQYFCNLLIKKKQRLNSNRSSGSNSIPYRILFLLKNGISKQLADLFNLSFMNGVFLLNSKLKAKAVPVFKKDLKLNYSNYC